MKIFTQWSAPQKLILLQKDRSKIIARAPWLFTTFIGGIISAWILGIFDNTLSEYTAIILFIPFVIGLAGNVGIQGATVIVRGLATGDIQEDNITHIVKNEMLVGVLNGTIFGFLCGALVSLAAEILLNTDPLLGVCCRHWNYISSISSFSSWFSNTHYFY